MKRLLIETCGAGDWRTRLADPAKQWKRKYSALETAVAWESAAGSDHGLPLSIYDALRFSGVEEPTLLMGVAEHKVPLDGLGPDSQCDVWALIRSKVGMISMSVEAKVNEDFGTGNETLSTWLKKGETERSQGNRLVRWQSISEHLPVPSVLSAYENIPYQLLHRCATCVIEAKRFRLDHAIFIVQAFSAPTKRYEAFGSLCEAVGVTASRGHIVYSKVAGIKLGFGWVDCEMATDKTIASVV